MKKTVTPSDLKKAVRSLKKRAERLQRMLEDFENLTNKLDPRSKMNLKEGKTLTSRFPYIEWSGCDDED